MSEARYIVGDVFEEMAKLPDGSVDLIVTSPPFLALRSYLPQDHPDKGKEIGSESTPAAFLSMLLRLTQEWRRLLAPHGSIAVELGDTYSGSGGAGGDWADSPATTKARVNGGSEAGPTRRDVGQGWPQPKSLCGIPDAYALSLEYGWNMLNPTETCPKWRVRNKIVWARPNPPVGALGDKVRPSTSYITIACISDKRWFDLDAERTPHAEPPRERVGGKAIANPARADDCNGYNGGNPAGAPLLDHWIIPTAPYTGSHYATFPPALPRRLINLMCPRQVCTSCGEPRRRITSQPEYVSNGKVVEPHVWQSGIATAGAHSNKQDGNITRTVETLGWSDCGCVPCPCGPDCKPYCSERMWRRGIVLDPFAGSGTTLMAASELGRDSIGIDLDHRNLELARERCGMFLTYDEVTA